MRLPAGKIKQESSASVHAVKWLRLGEHVSVSRPTLMALCAINAHHPHPSWTILHRVRRAGGFFMACSVGRHDLATTVPKRQTFYRVGAPANRERFIVAVRPEAG
ncbi:hypothetical protein PspLS_09466 [Pyricularia sp. CBS 133598]|nr:hypothetical protein PspLS_09466 [Pyricularia sp. CBS 133598]